MKIVFWVEWKKSVILFYIGNHLISCMLLETDNIHKSGKTLQFVEYKTEFMNEVMAGMADEVIEKWLQMDAVWSRSRIETAELLHTADHVCLQKKVSSTSVRKLLATNKSISHKRVSMCIYCTGIHSFCMLKTQLSKIQIRAWLMDWQFPIEKTFDFFKSVLFGLLVFFPIHTKHNIIFKFTCTLKCFSRLWLFNVNGKYV